MARNTTTVEAIATHAEVDPKSVERWLAGRTPRGRHRWTVAALLGEDESYLWPGVISPTRATDATRAEFVGLYAHRADVPLALWTTLLDRAARQIDVLAYSALFLPEQHPDLVDLLRQKCGRNCQVRIALGDPDCEQVRERDEEEQLNGMAARIHMALAHYRPLRGCDNLEIALHSTTLYNSIFRFDDDMLVNTHVWGSNAFKAPVLHLRRLGGGSLFDTYAHSFEAVWAGAASVEALAREAA